MRAKLTYLAGAFAAFVLGGGVGSAQSLDDIIEARIQPGWTTASGSHMAGLVVRLAPGWKTYWRQPGAAGIPPRFDFSRSSNLRQAEVHWPTPEIHDQFGARTFGYEGVVVLPLELTPNRTAQAIYLDAEIEIGVCADICVPVSLTVDAGLPADATERPPALMAALLDRPRTADEANVNGVACRFEPTDSGLQITAKVQMPRAGAEEALVVEVGDPTVWVSDAQTRRSGTTLEGIADIVPTDGAPLLVDRSAMTITVLTGKIAVEIRGCP